MATDNQYPAAFCYVIELAERLCPVRPLNKLPGCWSRQFGIWTLRLNGHDVEMDHVPPFSVAFTCNGWPAGIVAPDGGCVAGVSEDELNKALLAELERVRQSRSASF